MAEGHVLGNKDFALEIYVMFNFLYKVTIRLCELGRVNSANDVDLQL